MAKKSSSTQHTIHGGLGGTSASVDDSSRSISSKRSVNEGATREGVAAGTSANAKDKGRLK